MALLDTHAALALITVILLFTCCDTIISDLCHIILVVNACFPHSISDGSDMIGCERG